MLLRGGERQHLVVPDAGLPGPVANAIVGLAWTVGVEEGPPVDWHAEDHLVRRNAANVDVVVHCLVCAELCAGWLGGRLVDVGLVARGAIPGAGEVIPVTKVSN